MNGVNFYFLFCFASPTTLDQISRIDNGVFNASIEWLRGEIDLHEGPKVIVIHYPMYSTGNSGSYPLIAHSMEDFFDSH